ncbi:MAG: class I SAM-dependent methyltransferase [Acidobacteriota bacterium]
MECLVCQFQIEPFMSFGKMPIANGFLTPEEFPSEYFFELRVSFCPRCHMVQLAEQPDRSRMFHENYAFFSSTSVRMAQHFEAFAGAVQEQYLTAADPFVVEIGSNDGITLRHFAARGIRHLGIEPSANVASVAIARGVRTIGEFFDQPLAEKIVAGNGQADAIIAANVMCHIPYLHSVMAGVERLLKPGGVLIFEDPYLGDIVEKTSYDQIYDEHAFYFSVGSLTALFDRHGLEIVDVQPQAVHGGSMRYVVVRKGARPAGAAVAAQRDKEQALGLGRAETYRGFAANVERSRDALMALLRECQAGGKRVVGYAATSKSTTVINYCGITPDLVEFISDTTPVKQGKFSPGMHIPVRPYQDFQRDYPDYGLLFGWNHGEEIRAKERAFTAAGGRWIVYVPAVEVGA